MADIFQHEKFSITWKLEKIHLSNAGTGCFLSTPCFLVKRFQNTSWQLMLMPSGSNNPLFMGFALKRISSDGEPDAVRLCWTISVIAEGGTVRFEKIMRSTLTRNQIEDVHEFIRKSELLPTDTPRDCLTIYCEMINDPLYSAALDAKYDFEALSSDLASLFESGFRSDFKMYCRGKIFNVHKFILVSRWPSISERLTIDISTRDDIIMTDIEPSTLKSFLTYLYTGKLQRKDITMELCSYMHENFCDDHLRSFETPVSRIEFVTHMHHEWKQLTWEVGDEEVWSDVNGPFFRVIPLEEIYPSEMVIIFSTEKRDGEEWLKLVALFTGFTQSRPLLLDGEISFLNKNAIICSTKFHHLLDSNEEWCLPRLVKKKDLIPNASNSKRIEIEMYLCDGCIESKTVSTTIDNASRFKEVSDLRKLRIDLIKTKYKQDLKLILGLHVFLVHSTVLAARSEKFRKMIEQNSEIIEIKGSFCKKTAKAILHHLYGGRMLDLNRERVEHLNKIAKEWSLASLEEKTERMLISNLFSR